MLWGASRFYKAKLSALMAALIVISAQSINADPDLAKGIGPLPDPAKGARAGALVTAEHSSLYNALLLPELAKLNEQGEFVFEALRAPKEPTRFTANQVAREALTAPSSNGELKTKELAGLPTPLFNLGNTASGDLTQAAYKILWNAASLGWKHAYQSSELSLLLFKAPDSEPHKLGFEIERIHPSKMGLQLGGLDPIFRETISASTPEAIKGLSWLTLRFFGQDPDFVWAASPVINRVRQLTGSNRSDQIFTGIFSPDDLFVWSGKVELAEPVALTLVSLLIPILEDPNLKSEKGDDCSVYSYKGDNAVSFNYQSARFKGAGKWVPSNVIMVPRQVWRIEMIKRDPFSLDTRETLYVDKETGMPIYRVVWDQGGRLRKVTVGFIRSVESVEAQPEPQLAGQVILSGNGTSRLALVYDSLKLCPNFPRGKTITDFDPSLFVTLGSAEVVTSPASNAQQRRAEF
jgi:hypothetical protein